MKTNQSTAVDRTIHDNQYNHGSHPRDISRDWKAIAGNEANTTHHLPWDLTKLPNYDSALQVDVIQAGRLSPKAFWQEYVRRNRPCLIKDAIAGWPARRKWTDKEYLRSKVGDVEVPAHCFPRLEAFGIRRRDQDIVAMQRNRERELPDRKVGEWLSELQNPDDKFLFIELRPASARVAPLGEDLSVEGRRFSFLTAPPRPRFGLYSGWSAMIYKNSYSDWHFHPATEAVMCQVAGTKDVALLPPTQLCWDQLVPVHTEQWKTYEVDVAKNPAYQSIRPYHVVVEPGDGLFLPVNWWHAVQGRPGEFGITVPVTFNTPYLDLRQPATGHFLGVLWKTRKWRTMAAAAECAYSTATNYAREKFVRPA